MGRDLYDIRLMNAEVQKLPDSPYFHLDIPGFGGFVIPDEVGDRLEVGERGQRISAHGLKVKAILIDFELAGLKSLDGKTLLNNSPNLDIRKRKFAEDAIGNTNYFKFN